jgi:hypothetical protein
MNGTPRGQAEEQEWTPIGTIVGMAGTSDFTFVLNSFQATLGDIIAVYMEIPGEDANTEVCLWARVVEISRFNPFFPNEAAQEIANAGLSLVDTVLSGAKDQLEAKALVLGVTEVDTFDRLRPLTYPVQPASTVVRPPAAAIRELLIGKETNEKKVNIGTLIARKDVPADLSAPKLVSRHMAILAMTGGGKTVAARRVIKELAELSYPMVILDPHGDYIGLSKCAEKLSASDIKLFYPSVTLSQDGEAIVFQLVAQMTAGLTEPQGEFLAGLVDARPCDPGDTALEYIEQELLPNVPTFTPPGGGNVHPGTRGAVRRALRIVAERLRRMQASNERMRQTLKDLHFDPLPSAMNQPEQIVRPGQISIIYLGGYDHITQCSIAALTLEALFDHRANLSRRIPPFQTIIEEAHTFIPSAREGTSDAVTLPVVRRMITEGRKFGTGLVLISQRPSRLDETIVSQCNSFLILRLVNPRDQNFVRQIMENLTESDARMIPGFGPGQGIVSGQVVQFPLAVNVKFDEDLLFAELGNEDFISQVEQFRPDEKASTRTRLGELSQKTTEVLAKKRKP